MRVALVHDWLTGMRGGERVLEELCRLYPDASLFTLFHRPGAVSRRIESMPMTVSFLNRIPGSGRLYPYLLPLFPFAVSRFDLRGFDLVLSISHAAAKGITKPPGSLHICYCLTPMRYIWDMRGDYFRYADTLGIRRAALGAALFPLRRWDRATADTVDYFIADSRHVQERISRYYGRGADVIYPPVDTEFFTPSPDVPSRSFFLLVSALVSYKRVDVAVDAFSRMEHRLVVIGRGPDLQKLRSRAAPNIEFRGFVTDAELRDLYRRARGVIITAREDFGLVALEAQACGCPPLAYAAGGSLESVAQGRTGILFSPRTVESLIDGINRLESTEFPPEQLRRNAELFSRDRFRRAMLAFIQEKHDSTGHDFSESRLGGFAAQRLGRAHHSVTGISGIAKRSLDVLLSAGGILVAALPVALVMFLIRITSRGPALFFQKRLGLRGREFMMVKLRTMFLDAEQHTGPRWAVNDDARCTRLGGFLRRYSIDELPQLWNVLKGDMSLVGPRPERSEFHRIFEADLPEFKRRLEVRGGITGLAQIRGWRGDTDIQERLNADLEYIEHWSFWKDLEILCGTPAALLRNQNRRSLPEKLRSRLATADSTPGESPLSRGGS